MGLYDLCTRCTVRNCRRTPKADGLKFKCYKRKPVQDGFKLLEMAMGTSPKHTLTLVYNFGYNVKEAKSGGFKMVRRQLN